MPSGADASVTLDDAVQSLYDIAVVQGKSTSTSRLRALAELCVEELTKRGLPAAETEVRIEGGGRSKQWDVAWKLHDKYRLAISLKSILSNLGGTVPNRIDDLIGEVANIQMYSPEVVVGYVMVFDVSKDTVDQRWFKVLAERLPNLSGRTAPSWSVGMTEAFALVKVDFSTGPRVLSGETAFGRMLDRLIQEVRRRNPALGGEGAP